jgi:4-amino-4-deoxy-L-arabinose transferase-like glycosyltransferase
MSIDRRNLILCVLVTLAAILVAWPFAEGGYIDDFSYIHMTKTLAETGRLAYNGWPTAMLGIQVWWGAAWILLLGFSFTLVRLSVWPLALGSVALVYLIARRASLSPHDSLFAALLTALSTLFLPLAPTFMSDIPAFFLLLACFYGFARAADAADAVPAGSTHVAPRRALAWLTIGTLCGVLGGTIRQPVWFAPIACTAVLCLRRSGGLKFRLASLLCGAIGVAALIAGTQWFSSQPYAIPTRLPTLDAIAQFRVASIAREAVAVATECALKVLPAMLFCLPWVVEHLATGLRAGWGRITAVVTAIAMTAVLACTMTQSFEGPLGLLAGSWRPDGHALHDAGVGLIRCGVLGMAVAMAMAATVALGRARDRHAAVWRLPPAVIIPLAYLVPYGGSLLLVSQTTDGIYPRYYLPFLPALTCGLLFCTRSPSDAQADAAAHTQSGDRRSVLGWLLVGFFALRGIAILHDEFADTRTRLEAITLLQRQGVPRERITSKWVIDGWEQIERAGYVNDPRIRVPPDAYRAEVPYDYPDPKFRDQFPALRPDFMVVDEREITPGVSGDFPRFAFTAWWRPPYHRTIVIRSQPLPDGTAR